MANFNFNKVIIGGRLTAEPEKKVTQSGISVTTFGVAVGRKYNKTNQRQETDFFNVTAWRDTADFVARYFRKGFSICIVGTLQNSTWTDQNGQKHYRTDIVAEEVTFVDSKSENPFENQPQSTATPTDTSQGFQPISADDDLPF